MTALKYAFIVFSNKKKQPFFGVCSSFIIDKWYQGIVQGIVSITELSFFIVFYIEK